jgi:hypothetical protein
MYIVDEKSKERVVVGVDGWMEVLQGENMGICGSSPRSGRNKSLEHCHFGIHIINVFLPSSTTFTHKIQI